MKAKSKTNARLTRELLAMSRDMLAVGIMDKAGYEKITKRHLVAPPPPDRASRGHPLHAKTRGRDV